MVTHCSIPAWRIPWAEEPGGRLQSIGSQRLRHPEVPEHTQRPMEWMSKSFALSARAEITLQTGQAALAKTLAGGRLS